MEQQWANTSILLRQCCDKAKQVVDVRPIHALLYASVDSGFQLASSKRSNTVARRSAKRMLAPPLLSPAGYRVSLLKDSPI